jgi:hypothetical protein
LLFVANRLTGKDQDEMVGQGLNDRSADGLFKRGPDVDASHLGRESFRQWLDR